MRYFPLFHDTKTLSILVVGGGEVAARKVTLWAKTQAKITLVAPQIVPAIARLCSQERLNYLEQPYHAKLLADHQGVIAATDNAELNRQISEQAKALGLWVNVVDDPASCTVITPAMVERAPIVIAIGSEGAAPVLVSRLRAIFEGFLPQSFGKLAEFIASQRARVMADHREPRLVWQRFLQRNGLRWDEHSAEHLRQAEQGQTAQGKLWLISSEQDANLLPLAALPILQSLDAIYAHSELDEALERYCRRDAQRHYHIDMVELITRVEQGEQLLLVASEAKLLSFTKEVVNLPLGRFVLGQQV